MSETRDSGSLYGYSAHSTPTGFEVVAIQGGLHSRRKLDGQWLTEKAYFSEINRRWQIAMISKEMIELMVQSNPLMKRLQQEKAS